MTDIGENGRGWVRRFYAGTIALTGPEWNWLLCMAAMRPDVFGRDAR